MARKENGKKNRKMVFGVISLVAAVGIIVGVGYAYFSDVITGEGSATAGTLDISGTPGIIQNTTPIDDGEITNLNPGDVISIDTGDIINKGSKSAWIRAVLEFTSISDTDNTASGAAATSMVGNLADWVWVCTDGTAGQADLIAAFGSTARGTDGKPTATSIAVGATGTTCVKPVITTDPATYYGGKTIYTLAADVIDGTDEADNGGGTTWTPAAGSTTPKIFFDQLAPNAAQNGEMEFNVLIQALQYRNNTASPDETQWVTVTTTPFATL